MKSQVFKKEFIAEILSEGHAFDCDMPIVYSKYGDPVWYFVEESDPLYSGRSPSCIDWNSFTYAKILASDGDNNSRNKYDYRLTSGIVSDLKIAAAMNFFTPRIFSGAKASRSSVSMVTIKEKITTIAKFLSFIIESYENSYQVINLLSDITLDMVLSSIPKYPGRSDSLKRSLLFISNQVIQNKYIKRLQWSSMDIESKTIIWRENSKHNGIRTMDDSQFKFLLNSSTKYVVMLKNLLGMEIKCKDLVTGSYLKYQEEYPNFKYIFSMYYEVRGSENKIQLAKFKRHHGYGAREAHEIIVNAHNASMMIILLLTGVRRSEAALIECCSICQEGEYYFLRSGIIKTSKDGKPIKAAWLAVDLVVDAYEILNLICKLTGATHLFSSPNLAFARRKPVGYSAVSLASTLTGWVEQIDRDGLFSDFPFSPHQARETLVCQLAKMQVGLPYISLQLNHLVHRLKKTPNMITAGYGNYSKNLLDSIHERIPEAKYNLALDIYGENAILAGGGADAMKSQIDAFFTGEGLYGKDREEYIRLLSSRNILLKPTSIGMCSNNFSNDNPDKTKPPCYGDLQCDPNCPSYIISQGCKVPLESRIEHVTLMVNKESSNAGKEVLLGLVSKLQGHLECLSKED